MAIENKNIAAIREDYTKGSLSKQDVKHNPFDQFKNWFDQALDSEVLEPNAMVLSTISTEGFPNSRVVLMKDIKSDGLSFFTNYKSHKGQEMEFNPKVSILFFWPELQRQIRMLGTVEKLSVEESTEYFQSRPTGSQIGAWSSPQSQIIVNREFLEEQVSHYEQKFNGLEVLPKPEFWGGFLFKPTQFEFWQGRSSRLHDRIVYNYIDGGSWSLIRLAP
jgi:pyridoxamine 5'-phosphate oxidase